MQFYYGESMPLRILDEVQFWKRQEEEHTVVIRNIVVNLESNFVKQLEEWGRVLAQTEGTAVKYIETVIRLKNRINQALRQQIMQFVGYALHQSQNFIALLNQMVADSEAVRNNLTAVVVINHIRRESEYFIGIAQAILNDGHVEQFDK